MLPHQPQHLQLAAAANRATAANANNPHLLDQLRFMREQETTHYQCCDYLIPPWTAVTPSDRRAMCSWSYDIVDACSIPREAACIGMNHFDRFLSSSAPCAGRALAGKREFQLSFIACLIIALKGRAGMQVDSDFVSGTICQKLYNEKEIAVMEVDVLKALGWRLNGPSPHDFVGGLLELLPSNGSDYAKERLRKGAIERIEQVVLDYSAATLRPPSSIAYDALLTAAKELDARTFCPEHQMAWMRSVAAATGMGANAGGHGPPMAAVRTPSILTQTDCHRRMGGCYAPHTAAAAEQGLTYCSPVSCSDSLTSYSDDSWSQTETEEKLYSDVLSMVTSASSDLSPVCAVFDESSESYCIL